MIGVKKQAPKAAAASSRRLPQAWRRRVFIGALVVILAALLGGAGLFAGGWYFSDQLLTPNHSHPDYNILVRGVTATGVVLDRTTEDARPGTWGLEWPGGNAILGAVESTSSDTVTRALERTTSPLVPGTRVALSSQVYWSNPRESFGLPYQDVEINSDVGRLPAWFVAGSDPDVAIVVHGYNAPITDGLRVLPILAGLGLPVLLIHYRNDVNAPASSDGLLHLGDTEWRDLESAVRWAIGRGARGVVLVGISMGGAVVGMFMQRSRLASSVAVVVLDSPVLSWDSVLHFQAQRRHLPDALVLATESVVRLRIGFDVSVYDEVRDAAAARTPTLLFQDGQETFVPPEQAAAFARLRPDIVEYHFYPSTGHAEEWNVDPHAYAATLSSFLARHLAI